MRAMMRRMASWVVALAWLLPHAAWADTVEYIHTDALGTPIAVTDASGKVIQTSEYAPYGELLNRSAVDGPGYTGHVSDAVTGLTYMQQRYYDPVLQIFYSRDPVTAFNNPVGQFNSYRYANDNPYSFSDPDGRMPGNEILHGAGGRVSGGVSGEEEIRNNLTNDGTRKFTKGSELERLNAALYVVNKVRSKVESVGNKSPDLAAKYFMEVFQPVSTRFGVELAASIVKEDSSFDIRGLWYLRNIAVGTVFDSRTGIGFMAPVIDVSDSIYNIHTHPLEDNGRGWNSPFSTNDIESYRWQGLTGYVSTPSLRLFKSESGGPIQEVK